MNDKLTLQELIDLLAARHQMEPQDADAFVREFWALIEEGLKSDNYVKIKGLGTFKLIDTEARESINIQTGERIEIQSHARVTFSPEASLRDLINRPFAHFETVVLNESTNFDDLQEVDEKSEAEEEEQLSEEDQPVVVEEEPVAEEDQPVAEEEEPVVEEEQPVAEEEQPVAEEEQPVAEEDQPVAEEDQPVAEEDQPVAEEEQPVAEEEQPVAEEEQPVVEEEQPVVEEEQPVVEEEQPVVEEEQPVAEEEHPLVEKEPSQELLEMAAAVHQEKMEHETFCRKSKRRLSWCLVTCALLVGFVIGGFAMLYFVFGNAEISENLVNSFSHADDKSEIIQIADKEDDNQKLSSDDLNDLSGEVEDVEEHVEASATLGNVETKVTPEATPKKTVRAEVKPVREDVVKSEVKKEQKSVAKKPAVKKPVYLSEEVQYKITGTIATHTLRNGETLTRVALKYYGNKKIWPYLVMHNKGVIKNPDNVPIGTTIKVPRLVPVTPGT